jgi:hypothetical protein
MRHAEKKPFFAPPRAAGGIKKPLWSAKIPRKRLILIGDCPCLAVAIAQQVASYEFAKIFARPVLILL